MAKYETESELVLLYGDPILGWMNIHVISTYFDVYQGFPGFGVKTVLGPHFGW